MRLFYHSVCFFCVFLFFPFFPAAAETIEPFVMPSARFGALGGGHTAAADDFYSIFLNPAALAGVKEEFSAAEITASAHGPLFEIIDLAMSDDDLDLTALAGGSSLAAGADIGGPLSVGWAGRGLGLGLFSRVKTAASVGSKLSAPVSAEVLLTGGYAFKIVKKEAHSLDAGFLGKGFFRGAADFSAPIYDILTVIDDPLEKEFGTYLGLGLDLGLRYSFRENFTAAVVCYDVYSPVLVTRYASVSDFLDKAAPLPGNSYATVRRRLDAGVRYRVRSAFLDRYISRIVVMADYHDFLDLLVDIPRNPVLNAGIGLEVTLLNALSIRAGIADALPAVGFGLDLSFMEIDFAIRGRELGIDPGVQPVYAMDLGLLFRY